MIKQIMLGAASIVGASLMATTLVHADDVADIKLNTSTMVTDHAHMLTQKTKDVVRQADNAAKQAPLQGRIAMVTVNSTDGESIDDYSKTLLSQPDWRNMSGKYGIGAVIIFAKNNGQNNVRISTTNNAEAFVDNQTAMTYLKNNTSTLKSADTSKINTGLQHVTTSIQKDFVNGNPDVLSNSDSDDDDDVSDMIEANGRIVLSVAGHFIALILGVGVFAWIRGRFLAKKYRKLSHETVVSNWYKAVASAVDLSTFKSVRRLSGGFHEVTDANGDKHVVDRPISQYTAGRVLEYLEETFPELFTDQKITLSKTGNVVISSKTDYQNWLKVARELETVDWRQVRDNADFYEGTLHNKRAVITASMYDAIPMKSMAELSKYVEIGTTDIDALHDLFGTQDQYSVDMTKDIPEPVYDRLFPTEKMYKEYKANNLSKSQFSETHDGYQQDDVDDILSPVLYGLIFTEMTSDHYGDYDSGYDSGSSFDSGSDFSSFDGGGFGDGGGSSF